MTPDSGISIAAIVLMSIVIVVLALALIKARHPTGKVAQIVTEAENEAEAVGEDLRSVASRAEDGLRSAAARVEPMILKAEIGVDTELASLLNRVESRLLDSRGEDAVIAAAQAYLARVMSETEAKVALANNAKQAKLEAMQAHIAALQAAVPATATVNGGPTA